MTGQDEVAKQSCGKIQMGGSAKADDTDGTQFKPWHLAAKRNAGNSRI